jgi:hypothetical protein
MKKYKFYEIVDFEGEEWKPIKGYNELYAISNRGRVKTYNFKKEKLKYIGTNNVGYNNVTLTYKKHTDCFLVHRLVAEYFISNPENKTQVNHKNGNRKDNAVENLEWVTDVENKTHCFEVLRKTRLKNTKIDEAGVLEIREGYLSLRGNGTRDFFDFFATKYSMHRESIRSIARNKTFYDTSYDPNKREGALNHGKEIKPKRSVSPRVTL